MHAAISPRCPQHSGISSELHASQGVLEQGQNGSPGSLKGEGMKSRAKDEDLVSATHLCKPLSLSVPLSSSKIKSVAIRAVHFKGWRLGSRVKSSVF